MMTDKSYVSMEQHRCFVCGKDFDSGSILLDRRLRPSMERHTVTQFGICPEHQKQIDDGFVILLGATGLAGSEQRTGDIISVRQEAFTQMFNVPVPPKKICFIEPQVVAKIKEMVNGKQDSLPARAEGQEPATGPSSDGGDATERTAGSPVVGDGGVPPQGQLLQEDGPSESGGASEFTEARPSDGESSSTH